MKPTCKRLRPRQPFPAVLAHLGQGSREIQGKFMRLGILARIVAATTIVAQVCEMADIAIGKGFLTCQRGKDRAEAFAIAAGVTNLGLAAGLLDKIS